MCNLPDCEIPYGFCHCGCGGRPTVALCNNHKRGMKQGEPRQYCPRHNRWTGASLAIIAPNRTGTCLCGCGQPTEIARQSDKRFGFKIGESKPYIFGHNRFHSAEGRFWAKVKKTDSCWLWHGYCNPKGYGQFHPSGTTPVVASRYSWELAYGAIPDGLFVLHNCPDGDNPACVNPAHLWLGTQLDNSRDCVAKGRTARGDRSHARLHPERVPRGSRHHNARLTEDQIRTLKQLYTSGHPRKELSRMFGVSLGTVNDIGRGLTWAHIK